MNNKNTNFKLETEINKFYEQMDYRPTVISIVRNNQGNLLFVQSTRGNIHLPQGGIEPTILIPEYTSIKELQEEVNIDISKIKDISILSTEFIKIDRPQTSQRRGFSKGKAYLPVLVTYDSDYIKPDGIEIINAFWANPKTTVFLTNNCSYQKKELYKRYIDQIF